MHFYVIIWSGLSTLLASSIVVRATLTVSLITTTVPFTNPNPNLNISYVRSDDSPILGTDSSPIPGTDPKLEHDIVTNITCPGPVNPERGTCDAIDHCYLPAGTIRSYNESQQCFFNGNPLSSLAVLNGFFIAQSLIDRVPLALDWARYLGFGA